MKQHVLCIVIALCIFIIPTQSSAQVACPNPGVTSSSDLFDPNAQLPSGYGSGSNSFGGLNFSGVGGALAGCLNVGGSAVSGLTDLFNGTGGAGVANQASLAAGAATGSVPVADRKAATELEKVNQREQCLNGAAYGVAKNVLQNFSNKTINWAKSGYDGNPFYVRDIDSYMSSLANDKISTFLRDVPNTDPVFGVALRSVIQQQVSGFSDGRISKLANTPEAQDYLAFQNDFTQGGWNSFLNPRNNALGAYFNSVDVVSRQIETAEQNTREELQQGDGFLSMKRCAEYESDTSVIAANGTKDQASCTADYNAKKTAELKTCDGRTSIALTACTNPIETKYVALLRSCASLPSSINRTPPRCLRYETVTPGQIISSQVSAVVNSPINQLVAADSINEVLGGFFDGFLNNLFGNGLGSLGRQGNTATVRGFNVVRDSNGNPLPGVAETISINGNGIQSSCVQGGYSGDFDISRPQQLRAIIQAQKDYLTRVSDNAVAISEIVPYLGKLDHCIPGPNPTWENGLQDNFNTFQSSFRTESKTTPTGGALLGSILGSNTTISWVASPSLFDKAKGSYQPIRKWNFQGDSTYTFGLAGGFFGGISGQNDNSFFGFLNNGFAPLIADYKNTYSQANIIAAFTNIAPTPAAKIEATAKITESLTETALLPTYAQIIPGYQTFYTQSVQDTSKAIAELEAINTEMLQIVDVAKTRYINERKLAGNPVDMACIDAAYVVNKLPIVAPARGKPFPISMSDIQASNDASIFFYNNL